jgi:hypothetical protein
MPTPSFYKLNAHTSVGIIKPENLQVKPGQVFSRLTVCGNEFMLKRDPGYSHRFVVVVCDCGTVKCVRAAGLLLGSVKSCGCLHKELNKTRGQRNSKHALCGTSIYKIWKGMKLRCFCKTHHAYKQYGAKGITVCDEWRDKPEAFYEWSSLNGWREGLTIDRKDNDLGYSPENCRWATMEQQANNKTNTLWITHCDKTQSLADWCREPVCQVPYKNVLNRIQDGWDFASAITKPVRQVKQKDSCRPTQTK